MRFLNREEELGRLDALVRAEEGRLAVVYGRRRVGKTRLLLEWTRRHGGLYTVADQSAPEVQRRYFASAVAQVLPGFDEVTYPDWAGLLSRLAREARQVGFRGPLVIDELPYLALNAPELASVLQRFIDHDARQAGLKVAVAGSSQRMMQGLALSASAPLYGRAHVLFEVKPLSAAHLRAAFHTRSSVELCELYTAWGGIPRYWELAIDAGRDVLQQVDSLVLDPLGPLHAEADRLLLEELPPAVELRPILDAIGLGAHRASEIGARIGRQVTSLARPLQRLQELGFVVRETPFGESESQGKRSLYKLADPFIRLWFRVVAPHRGQLLSSSPKQRLALLRARWPALAASAWEELCRTHIAALSRAKNADARAHMHVMAEWGPWQAGKRWWQGNLPEWDLVSRNQSHERLLVAEVKWSATPFTRKDVARLAHAVSVKPLPALHAGDRDLEIVRALCIPAAAKGTPAQVAGVQIVTGTDLLR